MTARVSQKKIVFVGGGSNAWIPNIVKDMFLTESLARSEFVLFDINRKASDLNKVFLDKLASRLGVDAKIVSTDNRARALDGADYIIITISTGGLDAMAHDLAIPEQYGIYHTVGDTTGPGGWARLIRNFDVFVSLAEAFNRYAPRAVVLNYTNPMSTLTDVLARLCKAPVIGLCHGLFENLAFIKRFYKVKSEDDIAVKYAGLNHFFWITEARAGKRDVIADLRRRLKKQSLTDLLSIAYEDPHGHRSNRELATELFRLTSVMPYLGDRHTCECFASYITNRKNMRKYRIVRTSVAERRKGFRARTARLKRMIRGKIDESFSTRSRETAADIIDAHSEGKTFIDVGNLPNTGQITNLTGGLVVETAVRVDRTGFTPIHFGDLPEMVQGMIEPYAHVFGMGVDACFARDRKLALQALRLDPVCAHLNTDEVNEMGGRLLKAHKRFIKCLK